MAGLAPLLCLALSVSAFLPFSSLTTPVIPGLDLPPSAVLFLDIKLGEAETVH